MMAVFRFSGSTDFLAGAADPDGVRPYPGGVYEP